MLDAHRRRVRNDAAMELINRFPIGVRRGMREFVEVELPNARFMGQHGTLDSSVRLFLAPTIREAQEGAERDIAREHMECSSKAEKELELKHAIEVYRLLKGRHTDEEVRHLVSACKEREDRLKHDNENIPRDSWYALSSAAMSGTAWKPERREMVHEFEDLAFGMVSPALASLNTYLGADTSMFGVRMEVSLMAKMLATADLEYRERHAHAEHAELRWDVIRQGFSVARAYKGRIYAVGIDREPFALALRR